MQLKEGRRTHETNPGRDDLVRARDHPSPRSDHAFQLNKPNGFPLPLKKKKITESGLPRWSSG